MCHIPINIWHDWQKVKLGVYNYRPAHHSHVVWDHVLLEQIKVDFLVYIKRKKIPCQYCLSMFQFAFQFQFNNINKT